MSDPPKVFISYSHDSGQHRDRVLELSDRLRADGVDCEIDQYEESPPEGWPRWMVRQIRAADYVLVVCTRTYARRFSDDEPAGRGKGAKWEGAVITQAMYEAEGHNTKFIPVVMNPGDLRHVPDVLRSATHYVLDGEAGYQRLYRRLTGQPGVQRPALGKLVSLPARRRVADENATGGSTPRATHTRAAPKGAAAVQRRQPQSQRAASSRGSDLVLIRRPDGEFAVVPYNRIDRAEQLSLQVGADRSADAVFLNDLRSLAGRNLHLAYDLHATSGRLRGVRSTRQGSREVWTIDIDEEPDARGPHFEVTYHGVSADQAAEAKARHILLGERLPDHGGTLGYLMRMSHEEPSDGTWERLAARYAGDRRMLLAAARLSCVLELARSGVVAHVHQLHIRAAGKEIAVDFEGRRPRVYTNAEPAIIRVHGRRPWPA